MDALTQLSTDVPLYFRFYDPTTGAPYAPTPAPTVTVYRVNEADGTRTALVAALTALTAISGLTGVYTYLLDDSLNTALGQLVGEAVTTDAALTPYPEYATRTYIAEVEKFAFTGAKVNSQTTGMDTGVIAAASFAAGAFDAVWTVTARSLTSFGTLVADAAAAVWAAGTRLLTAGTNIVLTKGTGVTGFTDLSAAAVNAEVDTALADYDAPTSAELDARTLPAASYATASALDAVDNFVDTEMTAVKVVTDKLDSALVLDGAVWQYTANALELAPSGGGGGMTAAQFFTTDSGEAFAAAVEGSVIKEIVDGLVSGAATVQALVDGVLDELLAGHATAGTAGKALIDAAAGGGLDAAAVRAAIGLASANLDTQLTTIDNFLDTEVVAIKIVTDKVDTALALDGAVYQFTVNALELAPSGGGGGSDPLLNAVPGAYVSGTAGFALGRIDDIEAKTNLITADTVSFTSPVTPTTGDLTLYDDTDYSVLSGSTLPTWTNADWSVHDLSAAVSITLTYRARGTATDTALGTVTAVDDTTLRLTVTDEQFAAVPYGNKQAGFKIVAVLDVAHGSAEVQLVNAALSHFNYTVVQ